MPANYESIDLTYQQFRAEYHPMPIARTLEQLGDIIDLRVKPGLDSLYEDYAARSDVAYAGYALTRYLYPQQRLEFQYPDAAEALKLALVGTGAAIASGPRPNAQDFYLRLGNCFDIRALAWQNRQLWREGVYKQPDFRESAFILGPVVRLRTDGLPSADSYNQRTDLVFSTRHAVFVSGATLLEGLFEADPRLREGFAIREGLPHKYLAETFDLQPQNTSFQDGWLAQNG